MALGYRDEPLLIWCVHKIYRRWFETARQRKRRVARAHREYCERRKNYRNSLQRLINLTPYFSSSSDEYRVN